MSNPKIAWVKGGGDLGTAVSLRLYQDGYRVVVTELSHPLAVRRSVALASAVYEGSHIIENVVARHVMDHDGILSAWQASEIPVIVEDTALVVHTLQPGVLVDAIMAKHNTGTKITDAPVVIALGPGFVAGTDCHAVIETQRGLHLGEIYLHGSGIPNSGIPGEIDGETLRRVLRAPVNGTFVALKQIGDHVTAGEVIAMVNGRPVISELNGVLRGIASDGLQVTAGLKVGDVDPRDDPNLCLHISDKARKIGESVLQAIRMLCHFND